MGRSWTMERQVTLHQLRVFRSVVEHGGFTRAAEDLCLSQPGVTHQISSLSQAVGCPLFRPGHGQLRLTDAGATLYRRACEILGLVGAAQREIDRIVAGECNRLRLCSGPAFSAYLLPSLISSFLTRLPGLRLTIKVGSRTAVCRQVRLGDADLGFQLGTESETDLEVEPMMEDQLVWFAGPDGTSGVPLALRELGGRAVVLEAPGSDSRLLLDALFEARDVSPRVLLEATSCEAMKRVVGAGHGIGVLFHSALRDELESGRLVALDVEGFPLPVQWCLLRRRGDPLTPTAGAFCDHLLAAARPNPG